jgi:hypothetical protein
MLYLRGDVKKKEREELHAITRGDVKKKGGGTTCYNPEET